MCFRKEIIDGNACGICVDPNEPEEIAEAIQQILNDSEGAQNMAANGRRAVQTKYNWSNEEIKLFTLYEGIMK